MDFIEISKELNKQNESFVNSVEWNDNWVEQYVIFADLIAFADRCKISNGITLNNIIRFHRAIDYALIDITGIKVYQFTDACYILTSDSKTALLVASNIQNECLLQNHIQMSQKKHILFYHMIVPKVVISKGDVLTINNHTELETLSKIAGISSKELLAGAGIVEAYNLEKKTTGGLVSVDIKFIKDIKKHGSGDSKVKTNSLYKKWRNDSKNKILSHDNVIDIPWLLLQPRQKQKGLIKIESVLSFKEKVKTFNLIWRSNFTDHLAEGSPTATLKQYGGGISHLCDLMKNYTQVGARSWDLIELLKAIEKI